LPSHSLSLFEDAHQPCSLGPQSFEGRHTEAYFLGPTPYLFLWLPEKQQDLIIKGRDPEEWRNAYLDCGQDSILTILDKSCGITNEYLIPCCKSVDRQGREVSRGDSWGAHRYQDRSYLLSAVQRPCWCTLYPSHDSYLDSREHRNDQ
jgi:hypothetical protein